MEISPELLSKLLLYSFLFGLALGAINDIFRISRVFLGVKYSKKGFQKIYSLFKYQTSKSNKAGKWKSIIVTSIYFIEDLFLMLVGALGVVVLSYYFDDGNIRGFVVISMLAGAVLWYASLGRIIIAFSEPIVIVIRFTVVTVLKIISTPILFLIAMICKMCKNVYLKSKKGIANITNIVYNIQLRGYYMKKSTCGFLNDKSFERKKKV